MRMLCVADGCRKQPKLMVSIIDGVCRYSMDVCFEHGEWAEVILSNHVKQEVQKQLKEGEDED